MQTIQQREQLKSVIETISNLTESAVTTRKEGKDFVEVEKEKIARAIDELKTILNEPHLPTTDDTLSQILVNTQDIKKELKTKQDATLPRTWSQVASTGTPGTAGTYTKPTQGQQLAENRKNRELIVTITDPVQREEIGNKPTNAILDGVRTLEPKQATDSIVTLRRLERGDFQVVTATEASKRSLELGTDWLKAFAPSAKIKKAVYTVRAHAIRVKGVDDKDQKQAITDIEKANQRLHPGLKIARVAWTKRTIHQGKRYGSLIVVTESPETANQLITRGLVHESEIKICDRFITEARTTQCVRCQRYGHIAKFCRAKTTCATIPQKSARWA
jgi:hypothetical protein